MAGAAFQQEQLKAAIEQAVLQEVAVAEQQVDAALKEIDSMDKEELEEVEAIRRRRIEQIRNAKQRKQIGHGEYSEIGGAGNEKEFFEAAKNSDRFVCHFYRDGSPFCEIVDMHLNKLARKHNGTRFVKMNAEKAPFLAEKLKIIILPTIACVIKGKVKDYIVGFDDLGGVDDFDTEVMEWRLGAAEVLDYNGSLEGPTTKGKKKKINFIGSQARGRRVDYDSDSDDD